MGIHCAAGVSRSASIVLSYLIHKAIEWNSVETECIQIIRKRLAQDTRGDGDVENVPLRLSTAYHYVKSCRSVIGPNQGFCEQLMRFEKVHHNGKTSWMRNGVPNMWVDPSSEDVKMYNDIAQRRQKGLEVQKESNSKC